MTIEFGRLSITLLIGAVQALVMAAMVLASPANRTANRFLAAMIGVVALLVTPYIIGFAGFYDVYPWLSFSPFVMSLALGPAFYFYGFCLTGGALSPHWRWHFAPALVQFLSQALVFPLPLETKNWWDTVFHAPILSPLMTLATLASLTIYGVMAWHRYRAYCAFLDSTRSDGARFDPSWIRNGLIALATMGVVWAGFSLADAIDPSRDYFDRFWMYVGFCGLAIYLGVEGWRNAGLAYPPLRTDHEDPGPSPSAPVSAGQTARDWAALAAKYAAEVEAKALWRDPEITLSTMARALGANTTYLSRALNEGLGQSFSAFINRRRIDAVKAALTNPEDQRDILAIALDAGFNSKASFNRAFAEFVGETPSSFRKRARLKS